MKQYCVMDLSIVTPSELKIIDPGAGPNIYSAKWQYQ